MSSVTKDLQTAKVESLKRITKVLGPMAEKLYEELVEEYGGKRMYKRGEEKLAVYYTVCRILESMEKRIKRAVNGENIMNMKEKEEQINVNLSPEEYRKLKTIASAFRATAQGQIRQLINDDYQRNGEAYEEHLSNRVEQGEKE